MKRVRSWRYVAVVVAATMGVAGCSTADDPHLELRTPAQASTFLATVARHGDVEDWKLAPRASTAAAREWGERGAIANLGARIREGAWGCELAERTLKNIIHPPFSEGDRRAMTVLAKLNGAKDDQIEPVFSDALKMSVGDLREVTTVLCPRLLILNSP